MSKSMIIILQILEKRLALLFYYNIILSGYLKVYFTKRSISISYFIINKSKIIFLLNTIYNNIIYLS